MDDPRRRHPASQVFYNVLDNAIKYTPRGGRITGGAVAAEDRVEIEIEDYGSAICREHVPHVFKRFYRVEQSRNAERGGSGLGLAIAQSATVAHGGTISIQMPRAAERSSRSSLRRGAGRPTAAKSLQPQPAGWRIRTAVTGELTCWKACD